MILFWEVVNDSIVSTYKKLPSAWDGSFYSMEVKIFCILCSDRKYWKSRNLSECGEATLTQIGNSLSIFPSWHDLGSIIGIENAFYGGDPFWDSFAIGHLECQIKKLRAKQRIALNRGI
jgi:hypothetical protein